MMSPHQERQENNERRQSTKDVDDRIDTSHEDSISTDPTGLCRCVIHSYEIAAPSASYLRIPVLMKHRQNLSMRLLENRLTSIVRDHCDPDVSPLEHILRHDRAYH